MDTIAVEEMGMSPSYNQDTNDSASYVDIYNSLNNYLGLTDSNNQYKPRWPVTSSTIALNCMNDSLRAGFPPVLFFNGRLPGYQSSFSHYVTIIGCDYETGMVAFSDPHYPEDYFGIHFCHIDDINGLVSNWIVFHNSDN